MDVATPSTLQPRVLDTRGSRCLCTVLVHHRGCMDTRVPASADAKTKPGASARAGKERPRSGDTSPTHTGATLSRSPWVDPALAMKTTDRERPTASRLQFLTP